MNKAFVIIVTLFTLCLFSGMKPGPEPAKKIAGELPSVSIKHDLCIIPSENSVEDENSKDKTYKELEEEIQGIMEELEKLEEEALLAGVAVIKLDASLPSKRFYDSLGYLTLEETFLEVENGERLGFYKMEKPLTKERTGSRWGEKRS